MSDHAKTKQQLLAELRQLRQQVAELQVGEHQGAVRAPDFKALRDTGRLKEVDPDGDMDHTHKDEN